jgi:hypothetical protein
MVCLIRHAHAGDKHQWPGRDHDRPLSVPGQHEAHGLLVRLRDYPISRILTSPAVRCAQTVEPLSQRRAVPIELVDALRVDAPRRPGVPHIPARCRGLGWGRRRKLHGMQVLMSDRMGYAAGLS